MRFLPGNAQHIGARHSQQDSFGFADPDDQAFIGHGGFLAVVCDGMGGMEHGDAASRTAVRAFLEEYGRKTPEESIPAALERSTREANAQVVALAHSFGMSEGIGTTLVAAALLDSSLYFISVGDSALFHVSGGQMRMVNRPHIFANLLDKAVARGTLSREDAERHPERESLTSFIGAESLEEIDRNIDPLLMRDGDTILLASDGMFKTLEQGEILACLQGHPQSWPETLVSSTMAKGHEYQDNVTVLSVTAETDARAATPRTVLMAPPPPVAAEPPPAAQVSSFPDSSPARPGAGILARGPAGSANGAELPTTVKRPPAPSASVPAAPAPSRPPESLPETLGQPAVQSPAPAWAPVELPPDPARRYAMQPHEAQSAQAQSAQVQRQAPPPRSNLRLLWLLVLLLLAAGAAAAGWWYVKIRPHGPILREPILGPDRQVKAPKSDKAPDFNPDPNVPRVPPPVSKSPGKGGK